LLCELLDLKMKMRQIHDSSIKQILFMEEFIMKNTNIKRGQIYFCDIPKTVGSVYHSRRPVLVISNNRNNFHAMCFTAVPISSRIEKLSKKQPTHVPLHTDCGLYRESIAMCENVCNYSKESLCDFICEIDENSEVFKEIEKALLIQIGMAD
jgi:mRNA-degrading endonuclease toxin of MazEF toxin-antitoxin module